MVYWNNLQLVYTKAHQNNSCYSHNKPPAFLPLFALPLQAIKRNCRCIGHGQANTCTLQQLFRCTPRRIPKHFSISLTCFKKSGSCRFKVRWYHRENAGTLRMGAPSCLTLQAALQKGICPINTHYIRWYFRGFQRFLPTFDASPHLQPPNPGHTPGPGFGTHVKSKPSLEENSVDGFFSQKVWVYKQIYKKTTKMGSHNGHMLVLYVFLWMVPCILFAWF